MQSLGLIETKGMALGIEAIDAAMKSANVELLGYELARGEGRTLFKIVGDVGAVKAAVDAARSLVTGKNGVIYTRVIPRPSHSLETLIYTADTVGIPKVETEKEAESVPPEEIRAEVPAEAEKPEESPEEQTAQFVELELPPAEEVPEVENKTGKKESKRKKSKK